MKKIQMKLVWFNACLSTKIAPKPSYPKNLKLLKYANIGM